MSTCARNITCSLVSAPSAKSVGRGSASWLVAGNRLYHATSPYTNRLVQMRRALRNFSELTYLEYQEEIKSAIP